MAEEEYRDSSHTKRPKGMTLVEPATTCLPELCIQSLGPVHQTARSVPIIALHMWLHGLPLSAVTQHGGCQNCIDNNHCCDNT